MVDPERLVAAQHIVANEGLGMPASNADAVRLLGHAGLLDAGLPTEMAGAVGFRDVLVHNDAEVDDHKVVDNLDRVGELRRFVAAMARLLESAEAPADGPGTS